MVAATARTFASYAEYLEHEATAVERSEYMDGDIVAMSGGAPRHAAITSNVGAMLRNLLRGKPCRPTSSDQRIYIESAHSGLYPDVSVICGAWQMSAIDPHGVTNPSLVVEVLSPSTANHDRGRKFDLWRQSPDLNEILFISQDQPYVEYRRRIEGDTWQITPITSGRVELQRLGISLDFDEIYADLENLPPAAPHVTGMR